MPTENGDIQTPEEAFGIGQFIGTLARDYYVRPILKGGDHTARFEIFYEVNDNTYKATVLVESTQ